MTYCHVEKALHMRKSVFVKKLCVQFMVFCLIILLKLILFAIYAVLLRVFCCNLRAFVWRKK